MKMNKNIYRTLILTAAVLGASACQKPLPMELEVDTDKIKIGADGGVQTIHIAASDTWVAKTKAPWITVSPANGRGPAECQILIDSTLQFDQRDAIVRIQTLESDKRHDFTVFQEGYEKMIFPTEEEHVLESYADWGKRSFKVNVKSNVDFEVELDKKAEEWLSYEMPEIKLDRGARPREVPVTFTWKVNFTEGAEGDRETLIRFNPKEATEMDIKKDLKIRQKGAEEIVEGIEGDKKAILAIMNSMNSAMQVTTSEALENWENVTVWQDGPNKGRVRSVRFEMLSTKEPIPYQISKLTACEEVFIYSNANAFRYNLSTGEHICKMKQLKRLTIGAFGLTELHPDFVNLKNLEYLDLQGNNFQNIPEILNQDNFPKLHALIMHANQRNVYYDLSNTPKKDYGGFADASFADDPSTPSFPRKLLEWDNLDTLRLSVNYFQGAIPDMEHYPISRRWTEKEVMANDTLKTAAEHLIGKPKVLPNLNYFAINLNRLSGELPEWLLYHPKMDLWIPFSLVFEQEGKDKSGKAAGFTNRPANFDYYYKAYPNKKYNPNNVNKD